MRFNMGELVTGLEALRHELMRGFAVEHALAASVVRSVEPAQKLLEVPVRVDGDAEHLATNSTGKALHPAVRLWGVGLRMPVLRPEFGTSLSKNRGEATTVVGQHVGE